MKRNIYIASLVLFSIFLGTLFMQVSDNPVEVPVVTESNVAKIFEIGTYKSLEEAEKEASIKKGIVIQEEDYYKVYVSILKRTSNIERMISYLNENNIYFDLKDITIDEVFLTILEKYENLMDNSTSTIAFIQLNKKILERYKSLYES